MRMKVYLIWKMHKRKIAYNVRINLPKKVDYLLNISSLKLETWIKSNLNR